MEKKAASTLIETIVALIIIMIILTISVMTITNLQKNNLAIKTEAFFLIKNEFNKVVHEKLFFQEEKKHSKFTVIRSLAETNFSKELKVLNIEIINEKQQIIVSRKEIVSVD